MKIDPNSRRSVNPADTNTDTSAGKHSPGQPLIAQALAKTNSGRPPVWFMRQAGRYHAPYQELRKKYSFIDLCKIPSVACEATMGPIRDFDFDAAILFSDLLFPLESMGMGLSYNEGPKLDWYLLDPSGLKNLRGGAPLARQTMGFQAEAIKLIRKELSAQKSLLGFVGGPLTLYCYAVEGSHKGSLHSARAGLTDGRFPGFTEILAEFLAENMIMQAEAGADAIAMLDTCAGDFAPLVFREVVVPQIARVLGLFRQRFPDLPLIYYSKNTGPEHWAALQDLPIQGIGIDWHPPLAEVLTQWSDRWAIQGNIDPHWLFLDPQELEFLLRQVFNQVLALPAHTRRGWICGLGHGVLPKTPVENVRLFLRLQKELFT